ncbi:flagellar export protein FliJ [Ferrimonas sediminicola]|uniref:Flagellar FliJ protein n=1 Tax=Ferrimonas sediminicola TaxID=2569538 RepID=A0A4U1B944_9GAMM|nr:flagellar export protein FliJ [Ferrimonas sediminicola]TKB47238.1 flagellar export protein FliJ [Ferrimonas sediminicola]
MADPRQLVKVLELADKELEAAQLQLRSARSQADALREQLKSLESFRMDYVRQAAEKTGDKLAANHYQQYYHFVARLDGAIDQQHQQIQAADQAVTQFQQRWQQVQQKQKALSLLIDKEMGRRRARAEKREQAELDEFALQQFLRRQP